MKFSNLYSTKDAILNLPEEYWDPISVDLVIRNLLVHHRLRNVKWRVRSS